MTQSVSNYQRIKITLIKGKWFNMISSKEELNSNFPFNINDRKLMEYIDSVSSEMFSPWLPKLLMGVFFLTQHHEGCDIIKHVSQDCLHRVYFDPQKYPVSNQFQGYGYDLLYKDLATSAIKQGYQIVKKWFSFCWRFNCQ